MELLLVIPCLEGQLGINFPSAFLKISREKRGQCERASYFEQ